MSQVNHESVNSHYARIGMTSEGKQASTYAIPPGTKVSDIVIQARNKRDYLAISPMT